ncbi:MAG: hypothetical protein QNK37_09005 [Acidobacteriota bacterium]|nr:hypothetical protein [Acidobacteriota bacterium]
MRIVVVSLLTLLLLPACNDKKSDLELFDEGRTRINLSADRNRGYTPLPVNFVAYLENNERQIAVDVKEVKWVIRGPLNYKREQIIESRNFQDENENKNDTFYYDQVLRRVGSWSFQLIINDGEYVSNKVKIQVLESVRSRSGF